MSEEYLAWCAGFFDGEGTVDITHTSSGGWSMIASIGQKHVAVLELFQQRIGYGTVYRRNFPTWQASSSSAGAALRLMLPWLTVKKAQAEVAIAFAGTMRRTTYRLPPEVRAWREEAILQLRALRRADYIGPTDDGSRKLTRIQEMDRNGN